jgi:hypothetical protein
MIIPITKNTWDGFGSMIQVMKRSAGKDIPISLKNGDILDFKTSGTIWPSWVPLPPTINANGFNDLFWPLRTTAMDDGLWPLKDSTDANAFCLYAMIAEDEMGTGLRERFAVMDGLSSHIVSATPTHGRPLFLFLGINDFRLFLPSKPWIIMDGTGGFDCSVTVTTP